MENDSLDSRLLGKVRVGVHDGVCVGWQHISGMASDWMVAKLPANRMPDLKDFIGWHGFLPWWRHQMETCSALLAICEGNQPVTGGFPSQRPVVQSFMFSLIFAWTNGWPNNWDVSELRRHSAHYGINVMRWVLLLTRAPVGDTHWYNRFIGSWCHQPTNN